MNAKSVKIVRLTQDLPFIFRLERSSLPKSKLFYAAAPDESVRLNGSIDRWAAADPVLGTFWPLLGDHKRARACRSAFSRCLFPFWDIRRGIKPSLFSFPSFSIYGAFQSTSRSLREREDKRERERERERESTTRRSFPYSNCAVPNPGRFNGLSHSLSFWSESANAK